MPKLQNGSKGDSNPGSLDCEAGILPLSCRDSQVAYRAQTDNNDETFGNNRNENVEMDR